MAVRGSLNAFKNRVSGNGSVRHEDNLLKQMYTLIKTTDKQGRIGAVWVQVIREEQALAVRIENGSAYNWDEFLHPSASSEEAFTLEKLWPPMKKCTT